MRKAEPLSKISNLDVTDDSLDEKYKEFKEAINTGAFSDEYNLPSADVEKLHSDDVTAMIPQLLDMMFDSYCGATAVISKKKRGRSKQYTGKIYSWLSRHSR